jgi:hypothetical protein
VVVAIGIGVDRTHDAFAGKIQYGACFSPRISPGDSSLCAHQAATGFGGEAASQCPAGGLTDNDFNRVCGLGSHAAGLIAGRSAFLRGMAFDATLIPIQVHTYSVDADTCGFGETCTFVYESAALDALNITINLAAMYPIAAVDLDVVTGGASQAACDDDVLKPAIDRLRSMGILTVVPAGDNAERGTVDRPGCISTAVTVSPVALAEPSAISNYGPLVDVLAAGDGTVSAWPGNNYETVSGSNVAAAHVAGAIAMLRSLKPGATVLELETALKAGGVPTRASDWTWTTPRIDLLAAALRLLGANPPARGAIVTGVASSTTTGPHSYLRFHNADDVDGVVTVYLVDEASGATLGVWSKTISLQTSPQFDIAAIEADAVPPVVPRAGATYALYVDATMAGHVQHARWDAVAGLLDDPTACAAGLSTDTRTMINVHTSRLPRYPSFLQVTNTGAADAVPTFAVTDARTSTPLGTYRMPRAVPSGGTSTFGVSDVMEILGFPPAPNAYHVVMRLSDSFPGTARHLVFNADAGVLTDMTAKCDM